MLIYNLRNKILIDFFFCYSVTNTLITQVHALVPNHLKKTNANSQKNSFGPVKASSIYSMAQTKVQTKVDKILEIPGTCEEKYFHRCLDFTCFVFQAVFIVYIFSTVNITKLKIENLFNIYY